MTKRGFTLIELMVVLFIMVLLLAIVSLNYTQAQATGRDATRLSDLSLIGEAIDQSVASERGNSSNTRGGLPPTDQASSNTMCPDALSDNDVQNEINYSLFPSKLIPTDPKPLDPSLTGAQCTSALNGYFYEINDGSGNYAHTLNVTYIIEVGLENTNTTDETQFQSFSSSNESTLNNSPLHSQRNWYYLAGPSS